MIFVHTSEKSQQSNRSPSSIHFSSPNQHGEEVEEEDADGGGLLNPHYGDEWWSWAHDGIMFMMENANEECRDGTSLTYLLSKAINQTTFLRLQTFHDLISHRVCTLSSLQPLATNQTLRHLAPNDIGIVLL